MDLTKDIKTSEVIDRVMEAYGFFVKNDLCEHVGVSPNTVSTWVKRNTFPAELIIRCALDTGVSLEWLTSGQGRIRDSLKSDTQSVPSTVLINGELKQSGALIFDKLFLPLDLAEPFVLRSNDCFYFLDKRISDLTDGHWLVEIENKVSIRELAFIPVKKVKVLGGGVPFDCGVDEIKILSKVVGITQRI